MDPVRGKRQRPIKYQYKPAYTNGTVLVRWTRADGTHGCRFFTGETPRKALARAAESLLRKIKRNPPIVWTEEMDAFILKHYNKGPSARLIAQQLRKLYCDNKALTKNAVISRYNRKVKPDVFHSE